MKLAAIYNVWDCEYMLGGSIKQIRDNVDLVIVVYQVVSNYGESNPEVEDVVMQLKRDGMIDILVDYKPYDFGKRNGFRNECSKRNIGLNIAQNEGCTHFISMDCDEYYDSAQFSTVKDYIAQNERMYDFTRINLYTYFKEPTWRLFPIEPYYVPFICKLHPNAKLGNDYNTLKVDPTRALQGDCKVSQFPIETIVMHHYSWVRRDIGMKLRSSSAVSSFDGKGGANALAVAFNMYGGHEGERVPFYDGHVIKPAHNLFGISI
jgi:hypothetical protein